MITKPTPSAWQRFWKSLTGQESQIDEANPPRHTPYIDASNVAQADAETEQRVEFIREEIKPLLLGHTQEEIDAANHSLKVANFHGVLDNITSFSESPSPDEDSLIESLEAVLLTFNPKQSVLVLPEGLNTSKLSDKGRMIFDDAVMANKVIRIEGLFNIATIS